MDKRLLLLINSYCVVALLSQQIMKQHGIYFPSSKSEWQSSAIPEKRMLGRTISFIKNDFGCTVNFRAGPVTINFDGFRGEEIAGFELNNLIAFMNRRYAEYEFETEDELISVFNKAIEAGDIVKSVSGQHDLSEKYRYY